MSSYKVIIQYMKNTRKITPLSNEAFDMAVAIGMLRDSFEYDHDRWGNSPSHGERQLRSEIRDSLSPKKLASGCYRTAVIFDTIVVKYPRDHRIAEMYNEYTFIKKMRETEFARHFPITELVKIGDTAVLIQEVVNMSHRGKSDDMIHGAERLGEFLGIYDMHEGNFGWKGPKGREYPVFVDVDLRQEYFSTRRKKPIKRSWMV